jgi:hypothetical protein
MKKQLIAAAVAATVSAAALADISITGAAQVNYTNVDNAGATPDTNKFTQETSLKIVGKSGDTEVVIGLGGSGFDAGSNDDTGASTSDARVNVEDLYMTTKIGDVSIKSGAWDNGNNELRASGRNAGKFQATTSVGAINLGFLTSSAGASAEEFTVGTSLGGVDVSFTQKNSGETVKASTTMGGVSVKYLGLPSDSTTSDKSYVELSTKVGDLGIKVGQAKADASVAIEGDTWMGDFETNRSDADTGGAYDLVDGQDVTTVELKTAVAGNTVTFRNTKIDGVAGADTDFNKFIVTRSLTSGATFEATYTALDSATDSEDTDTLDLELRVNF